MPGLFKDIDHARRVFDNSNSASFYSRWRKAAAWWA
jgi:hypothetical protein